MLECEKCNYTTNRKTDYEKHLLTTKHLKNTQKIKFRPPLVDPIYMIVFE